MSKKANHRVGRPPRITLDRLQDMNLADLQQAWAHFYNALTPAIPADLLRLGIAYSLQENRLGGLTRESKRDLKHAAAMSPKDPATRAPSARLSTGTRLVRDWHGAGHVVTVLDQGFEYDGKTWRSLSAIAKAITGAHHNGRRFFGLMDNAR
jgi:hypothetical protein